MIIANGAEVEKALRTARRQIHRHKIFRKEGRHMTTQALLQQAKGRLPAACVAGE